MDKRGGARLLAFSGAAAGGAVILLLLARVFPTGQLGLAAAASLFVCAVMIEYGAACAAGVWFVSSALGLILAPSPAAWLYAAFFGYYPIVKLLAEGRLNRALAWAVKCASFAAALTASAALLRFGLIALPENLGVSAWYIVPILVVIAVIYDIGYGKLIELYKRRIKGKR